MHLLHLGLGNGGRAAIGVAAGIPILAGVDEDKTAVRSGDRLRLNPAAYEITVLDEEQNSLSETDR